MLALESLGPWESFRWLKSAENIALFEAQRADPTNLIATAYFIRSAESEIWKAYQDMLANALKITAVGLQGFYGFEMLAMELTGGVMQFRFQDLTQLLINHSKKMETGDVRLIQYGGLLGVFKKRVDVEWGKVDFKSCVHVERREKERLDLVLKSYLREARALCAEGPLTLLACDLSQEPFYELSDAVQAERLAAWYQKLAKDNTSKSTEIFYRSHGKNIKLWPV